MEQVLKAGLYIVGTPIGNLDDISLRALHILKNVDLILCEDTRVSAKLCDHFGISTARQSLHEHNEDEKSQYFVQAMQSGKRMALISDGGMPLISDPGFPLVHLCHKHDVYYTVIPGASSVLCALVLSGMASDRFTFCGFWDVKRSLRFQYVDSTLIFFESPRRVAETLEIMSQKFANRDVCMVREITKMFEEHVKGSFEELLAHVHQHPPRGEIVLVLSPPVQEITNGDWQEALADALLKKTMKEAVLEVSQIFGIPKRDVYAQALNLRG